MNEKVTTQKCRTCLKSSTKTVSLRKPVTGYTPDITYAELLKEYAQFDYIAVYERHLPQFLCFLCCSQLKSTYVFIQQAKQCNIKLINDITKQLCLQEQAIDLPQLPNEASVFIKKENLDNHDDLENQYIHNFNPNDDRNYEYNLDANKSFKAEPTSTTEQIIEYDFEDCMEMQKDNFDTETNEDNIVLNNKEEAFLSNKIETLETAESLLVASSNKLLNKPKPSSEELTITGEKCPNKYNKYEYLNHIIKNNNSSPATNLEESIAINNLTNIRLNCRFCDFIGKTHSGLRYHIRSKHGTEDDKLKCKFCSYTSLNKGYLLNHIKNVHKELIKTLKAKVSNSDESNSINPDINNSSTDNDDEQDKEEFSDEDFIRNLINMRKKPRKKLSTKSLVRRCEQCGKIFKNDKTLRAHQLHVHKSEDMFSVCPHCDKKCKRESDLKIHIREKHGPQENRQEPKPRSKEKRFMCAECSYTCTTSTVLNIHIRLHHTGERPYKCDICSKSFIVAYRLKIHRYLHTGEKPYKCSVCLKNFRDQSHMLKHKRLHTNEKPFTCDDCGKGFTQSYNLSVHKRTHLKGNKLSCSVCGKFFKNKSILNIHQINENHYDEVA